MNTKGNFHFRFHVATDTPSPVQALGNLHALCREHVAGSHQTEVVELLLDPARALENGMLLTPTLVKLSPRPVRKIIDNPSETQPVWQTFELELSTE